MFSYIIQPRFGESDCLGHINNTVLAHWFEAARTPLLRFFSPELKIDKESFNLILAHTEYDFMDELFFQYDVEIRTGISKIGTKSFTVYHEAWQESPGRPLSLCAKGKAVVVHYNFIEKQSTPLPEDKKALLAEHLISETCL